MNNTTRLAAYRERLLSCSPDAFWRAPHPHRRTAAATLYSMNREWPRAAYWHRPQRRAA
jgi:hypothetical protein